MTEATADHTADDFEDVETQEHAARLGLWVFLASEVLLFGALFALFASYRALYPAAFHDCVVHNAKVHGSVNTAVLLVSSTLVACSVHMLRAGRQRLAAMLVGGTLTLALLFLVIKATEYREHFRAGIYPGGEGAFFTARGLPGYAEFWTLYYGMTGLHAIHVAVGIVVLGALLFGMARGTLTARTAYRLELGATYWHLVDLVWIFLWPLFYLA